MSPVETSKTLTIMTFISTGSYLIGDASPVRLGNDKHDLSVLLENMLFFHIDFQIGGRGDRTAVTCNIDTISAIAWHTHKYPSAFHQYGLESLVETSNRRVDFVAPFPASNLTEIL